MHHNQSDTPISTEPPLFLIKASLLWTILIFHATAIFSQDKEAYANFREQTSHLSLQEIITQGDKYAEKEANDTAIILYSVAINHFYTDMPDADKKLCATAHLKAGNIYYAQGSYTNAMDVYIKGLKISESCDFHTNIIKLYNNIGNIYWLFQDLEKAATYYEKGYKLCLEHDYFAAKVQMLNNLTTTYVYIPNPEKAKYYFNQQKQLNITDSTFYEMYYYNMLLDEGLILSLDGKYKEAARSIKSSVDFAKTNQMGPWFECASYEDLYKMYQKLNDRDSTMHYLYLFYATAKDNGFTDKLKEALKVLPAMYEKVNDRKNAQLYKNEYLALTDSIFNFREFSRIKNLQFLYETEKYNKEINNLIALQLIKEKELKSQRKIMVGILISALIFSLLLITVYHQKRKLSRSYQNLFQINNEIVSSEKYNKNLRIQYEEKHRMKEFTIEQLLKEKTTFTPSSHETDPDKKGEVDTDLLLSFQNKEGYSNVTESPDKNQKYTTSNLNEDQKGTLLEAINSIMENTQEYCESDFSLEKLAMLVNSNKSYISQIINETYHVNFNGFVNKYRIREARIRLTDIEQYGNYTIQTISESVGYKSSTTFINVFKKITGITPSMYQKMVKAQKDL